MDHDDDEKKRESQANKKKTKDVILYYSDCEQNMHLFLWSSSSAAVATLFLLAFVVCIVSDLRGMKDK